MSHLFTIYALIDPDTADVRYVGRTRNNPWQRYSQHLVTPGKVTKVWIQELRSEQKVPTLKILEEYVPAETASLRERYWIEHFWVQAGSLLNYQGKPPPSKVAPPIMLAAPGALRAVLQAYGIVRSIDLSTRLGMKRQYAFMLWHGQRRLGHRLGKRIADEFGIPLTYLLFPESLTSALIGPRRKPAVD